MMETPVEYTITAHELATCLQPELLEIAQALFARTVDPIVAVAQQETIIAQRILDALRGWIGDDSLPLAEERSRISKVLYGDGEDEL